MAVADIARIEERIDKTAAGGTEVSLAIGGVHFQTMLEIMEFAKLMAVSGEAVPEHLRGNPGMCLAVAVQALEWRFSPFAVANKSYRVNGRLAFESQLVHAVIEKRAPIVGRIRHRYEGEDDERVCVVTAQVKGEATPLEYKSPPIGRINPKNSPLWKSKPDLQLYYNAVRDFCRVYFPDVLLGIYSEDELRDSHVGPERAKDITPKPDIADRLKKGKGKRGFDADHVERHTEPESGASAPALSSAVSTGVETGQVPSTQQAMAPAQTDEGIVGAPAVSNGDESGEARSHAGPMASHETEPVMRTGEPPSIFREYWSAINAEDVTDKFLVAKATNKFLSKHTLEDEDRKKVDRLRNIRTFVLEGVYPREESEEKAGEVIGE